MPEVPPAELRRLTLRERIQRLREPSGEHSIAFDAALADKRMVRWRGQTPYDDSATLIKRLARDGLTVEQLRLLLGMTGGLNTTAEAAQSGSGLIALWQQRAANAPGSSEAQEGRGLREEGFALLALPAVKEAEGQLRRRVARLPFGTGSLPLIADSALLEAGTTLRQQVRELTTRTLVLEMHVSKARGELLSEDPEGRYVEFLRRLLLPEVSLRLLDEYAVLARLLDETIDGWLAATSELFDRLAADWEKIAAALPEMGSACRLQSLRGGAGDLHRGRRSVHILAFAEGLKLVYKPRPLVLDQHFTAVCDWLREKEASLDLRLPLIVSRESHGWSSFVTATPCESHDAARHYYHRLGALLAVLHVLQGSDFHYENVIAAGEYPTPIDLEALLHARLDEGADTAIGFLRSIQEDSVLRVGLLPRLLFAVNGQTEGIDISGMGGQRGQMSPTKVIVAEHAHTDEMRIVRQHVELEGSENQPRIGSTIASAADYVEDVVGGFTAASHAIGSGAEDWLGPEGLLQRFANDRLRLVVRPTMVYAKTLQESYHPNLLRDAVDRDRLLERLWLGCVQRPELQPFFESEMLDLSHGEVPAFFFHPNSPQVWNSMDRPLGELLKQPTLHVARSAIGRPLHDSETQLWWIRAALAASEARGPALRSRSASTVDSRTDVLTSEQLLELASTVGDRLLDTAEEKKERLHWRGLHFYADRWSAGPVGIDLYNGSSGIGLFLAQLGKLTGVARYTAAARRAVGTSMEYLRELRSVPGAGEARSVGAFFGEAGLSLCLQRLSEVWGEAEWSEHAREMLEALLPSVTSIRRLTLGDGVAGFLFAAAATYRSHPTLRSTLEAVAVPMMESAQSGEGTSVLDGAACVWLDGWCGIGHSLVLAGNLLSRDDMVTCGLSLFQRGLQRSSEEPVPLSASRADGPFGIDSVWAWKAMLEMERLRPGSFTLDEWNRLESEALGLTTDRVSLHHGAGAHIDLLLDLEAYRPGQGYGEKALRLGSQLASRVFECDTPRGVETPGLMVGLAGTGATLLRCAAPASHLLL